MPARTEAAYAPTDHIGGIASAFGKDPGYHRGGCGLAVRARYRDTSAEVHQLAEEGGAFDDGDAPLLSGGKLRVVGGEGGCYHYAGGRAQVGGGVAYEDACSTYFKLSRC